MHHSHLWMESPASPTAEQTVSVRVRQRDSRGEGVHAAAAERSLCHPSVQPHEVFNIFDRFRPVLHGDTNSTFSLTVSLKVVLFL